MIAEGQPFPGFFLSRPDGTSIQTDEFKKHYHALLVFIDAAHPDTLAFVQRFQDEDNVFRWLNTKLVPIFKERVPIPSPWPAPMYSPFVYAEPLPEGIEWGKAYLVSKNMTLFSIYPELPFMSAHRVEQDVLHWEANHCLP